MTTRAERRQATEARILAAARANFAERGYDRTTIRSVAAAARVDPALVMQYFGSKDALFRRAVHMPADEQLPTDPALLTELLLSVLGVKAGETSPLLLPLLRSMFTHPDATAEVRATLARHVDQFAVARPGDDAELRAALLVAILLGVTVTRNMIELGPLTDASPEQIIEVLRPLFEKLVS